MGVAVSSNCIWRFDVASSEEKIVVALRVGRTTIELHLFWRMTG